ncbi:MAG: FAD-dependent oxidoreductase [Planctomycetota bacterium]
MADKPDFLVVGGGIIGLACAHYLRALGGRVTVIDRGTIGGACSHGNCGYICPSHVLPLTEPGALAEGLRSLFDPGAAFRIRPSLSPALWYWLAQFGSRCTKKQMMRAAPALKAMLDSSIAEYRDLVRQGTVDGEWEDRGLLYVFRSASALDRFGEKVALIRDSLGVSATNINREELPDFDPAIRPGMAGAYHFMGDASVRPEALISSWADTLQEKGVELIEGCAFEGLDTHAGRIRAIRTDRGNMPAGSFVFALGAWSSQFASILGCAIPIQPGKGYSITMRRPDVCPIHPMLFPEEHVGVSPFRDGYRLGSMMEFAGYDEHIPERRIQQLRRAAEPYLVEPHSPDEIDRWYGWRPMTWDSLPIIGRLDELSNVILATGHNMLGISMAAATGRLVAEIAADKVPHIDPKPYSPARFR